MNGDNFSSSLFNEDKSITKWFNNNDEQAKDTNQAVMNSVEDLKHFLNDDTPSFVELENASAIWSEPNEFREEMLISPINIHSNACSYSDDFDNLEMKNGIEFKPIDLDGHFNKNIKLSK
jgi:hypothetical protein